MRLNNVYGYLVACFVLGGGLAWKGWAPRQHGMGEANALPRVAPPSVASRPSERSLKVPARLRQPTGTSALEQNAFAPDDNPKGWDDLESAERLEHLEGRFTAALAAIEAGEQPVAKHAFIAESALTSMRAELYGTASGRVKHRNHEARLDHVLGEVGPGREGASR